MVAARVCGPAPLVQKGLGVMAVHHAKGTEGAQTDVRGGVVACTCKERQHVHETYETSM
jgi:hypothetical protein